jgi:hypothetical protein
MTAAGIAHLRIKLNDVEPGVVRRVEVPLAIRLDRLHLLLQAAMGWTDSHLYEFRARDIGWGVPDPDFGDGLLDARKARLADVVQDTGVRSLKYLYDFGDGWEHTVHIERITDAAPGIKYPRLIKSTGRCPPEDVGGPCGYRDLLEAIADPDHEQHAETLTWAGSPFDPGNRRCRRPRSCRRRPCQAMVTPANNPPQATHLTRGLRRRDTPMCSKTPDIVCFRRPTGRPD